MAAMETTKEKESQGEEHWQRERKRERAKKSAVYSDALTRFYVPLGRNGIHIVAVVRLILEAVTWMVNARKRLK